MVARRRGFTFTEVMLAMTILAAVGMGLDRPQQHQAHAVRQAFTQLEALTVAEDHLEGLRLAPTLPAAGVTHPKSPKAGFRLTQRVERIETGLVEITVAVAAGQAESVTLTTRLAGMEAAR